MTAADLCKWIRVELGKIKNTTDIEDADIEHEAGHILQRLNDKITKKVLRPLAVVYNQREYDVDKATIRVQDVFSNDDIEEMRIRLGSYIVSEAAASEDYNFPSLWAIKQMRRRRALPKMHYEFNPVERKLKIDPTPRMTLNNMWYVSIENAGFTLSTIPADFDEILLTGTLYKCLEIVALRRSTEGGILREGGRVEYPADALFRIAKQMQKEFDDLLDIKIRIYTI